MRKAAPLLTVVLTVLLMAGCGSLPSWLGGDTGSGPGSPSTTGGNPASAYQPRPIIVAFGDSLTAGFGADPGESYPDFLQQELDRRGYEYHVVNEGISGDTSAGGLVRTSIVAARKPQIVIICFGGNDGLRVLSVSRMRRNLSRTVEPLQKQGIKVVLCGMKLPPNYGADYREEFEQAFAEVAEESGAVLLPFLLEGVADKPSLMQDDGIHPNEDGNKVVAANVLKVLEPLLTPPAQDEQAGNP